MQILRGGLPTGIVSISTTTSYTSTPPRKQRLFSLTSKSFLFRCVPSVAEDATNNIFAGSGAKSFADDVVADIELCYQEIIAMCAIAFGWSLSWQ